MSDFSVMNSGFSILCGLSRKMSSNLKKALENAQRELDNAKKAQSSPRVRVALEKIAKLKDELNNSNNNNNNAARNALERSKRSAQNIENAFKASQRAAAASNLELAVIEQQPNQNENENDAFKPKEVTTPITEDTTKITDDMIDHLHALIRNEPQRIAEEKKKGKNIDSSPVFNYIRTVIQPEYPTYKTKNGIHMRYSVSDIYKQFLQQNPSLNKSAAKFNINNIARIQQRQINELKTSTHSQGGRKRRTHRKRKTLRKTRRHQ